MFIVIGRPTYARCTQFLICEPRRKTLLISQAFTAHADAVEIVVFSFGSGEAMVFRSILVMFCAGGLALSLAASADPGKDQSGNGYHEYVFYKYKHQKKRANQGPPPWAPAHGYRDRHADNDHEEKPAKVWYDSPQVKFLLTSEKIGINSGNCDREVVGTVMGGIIGEANGNKPVSLDNRTLDTNAGSLISVVPGKEIGRDMDNADAQCANQALERAPDGQAVSWDNPNNGQRYSVVPYETYRQDDGRYCRKYTAAIQAGSITKYFGDTACRTDDGVWEKLPKS